MVSKCSVTVGIFLVTSLIVSGQEVPELVNRVKEKLANVDQLVENMAQEHEDMLNKVRMGQEHFMRTMKI
jgi:hypothetical protein